MVNRPREVKALPKVTQRSRTKPGQGLNPPHPLSLVLLLLLTVKDSSSTPRGLDPEILGPSFMPSPLRSGC